MKSKRKIRKKKVFPFGVKNKKKQNDIERKRKTNDIIKTMKDNVRKHKEEKKKKQKSQFLFILKIVGTVMITGFELGLLFI